MKKVMIVFWFRCCGRGSLSLNDFLNKSHIPMTQGHWGQKVYIGGLLLLTSASFACGPFFPSSYISDMDCYFVENINVPLELVLLAQEYELIDDTVYSTNNISAAEADLAEFAECATLLGHEDLIAEYSIYAKMARDTSNLVTNIEQTVVYPRKLREFDLYLKGMCEMHTDSSIIAPPSWLELLNLNAQERKHRTSWVYYMLGNLAGSHGEPKLASRHYAACRQAVRDGFLDSIALAGASYKREFLVQTNSVDWVQCGVQAVAYYRLTQDHKSHFHCFNHLKQYFNELTATTVNDLSTFLSLECAALFMSGTVNEASTALMQKMTNNRSLGITPRLAWFMYDRGEIDRATLYLKSCPQDDILSNWIRFRIAQRNGDFPTAIENLNCWLKELQGIDRLSFGFNNEYFEFPQKNAVHGVLGNLMITQGHLQEAITCFIKAGSYHDAALIAERYIDTDTLKNYVDEFNITPATNRTIRYYYKEKDTESDRQNLVYLLARRLFRDNRLPEALPYYPLDVQKMARVYQEALRKSGDKSLSKNIRSAHLFHAARIMRWQGMELCGTELSPDYAIINGVYSYCGMDEEITTLPEMPITYRQTAPNHNVRFHYRMLALDLAERAERLAKTRHQRALILWCAGNWIKFKDPKAADIYYKKLANIKRSPLAKATYNAHWFTPPTPALESIYRSIEYIKPDSLIKAAQEYAKIEFVSTP